jgi:hypothetical protein
MQKLQLKDTLLIRFAGIRVRARESALVAPSFDCTLRDSAAMLSTNSQRIDTSESDPSSSSTAWSDPDVSESQAAYATLRDTSSSLPSIGPDITRQTMTSRTTICRALQVLFHSINCKPSRETGGCTHACPSRPSCNHTHTRAARQCRPTITTRSNIEHAHYSSLCVCV